MTSVGICWYLCGLLALSLGITSLITAHPTMHNTMSWVMAAEAAGSIGFGTLAVVGRRTAFLQARWVTWTLGCVAVLVTLAVLPFVLG